MPEEVDEIKMGDLPPRALNRSVRLGRGLAALAEDGSESGVAALSGWRRDLFGNAALELLAGRLFIGFEDGKVSERHH